VFGLSVLCADLVTEGLCGRCSRTAFRLGSCGFQCFLGAFYRGAIGKSSNRTRQPKQKRVNLYLQPLPKSKAKTSQTAKHSNLQKEQVVVVYFSILFQQVENKQ
jgi:hypothetical protein